MKKECPTDFDIEYKNLPCKQCDGRLICLTRGTQRSHDIACAVVRWDTVRRRQKNVKHV